MNWLKRFAPYFQSKATTFLLISLWSSIVSAEQLPNFSASFDIRVLGFHIGQAQQEMTCEGKQCLLTSKAEPPGWARKFINESTVEKIRLRQTDNQLKWLQYKKFLTRHYDDKTINKTYTLVRKEKLDKVEYIEKSQFWPNQKHLYDVISMAYGIQFQVLNKKPLDNLYLQDDKVQQKINFTVNNKDDEIDLPFQDDAQTKLFAFHNGKIDAQLWLMPKLNYFPVRIIILNKEEDRKIELELNHKPTLK
ncbi:DUF3108 domain-containing protein [Hydrogenovibrio sp. 3SP14C1]|uniref:DUF3108 domain-containing protein n=1 Tax=Hydrogenovibrio sp. 3SP14C1 TaxID=3038774 RepID=UPI002416D756|nr:DUF3108 domain-containing protein [Hydrogenovibrio sp. 3SP14C1]MDG4812508.1 DUF3108 domain-containing protein [Hydrogenovibrio sp. 3SP14C1]